MKLNHIEKPIVSESINITLALLQEKLSLTQQLLTARKKEILELEACLLEIDEDIEFQKLLKSKFKEFDLEDSHYQEGNLDRVRGQAYEPYAEEPEDRDYPEEQTGE